MLWKRICATSSKGTFSVSWTVSDHIRRMMSSSTSSTIRTCSITRLIRYRARKLSAKPSMGFCKAVTSSSVMDSSESIEAENQLFKVPDRLARPSAALSSFLHNRIHLLVLIYASATKELITPEHGKKCCDHMKGHPNPSVGHVEPIQ